MSFVNLLYLAATGLVVGPVLLHLLLRQRPQRQVLPTLRFLTASAPQSYAMHKLKNFLLLAARVLAILLIVLAFSRPYVDQSSDVESHETADVGMVLAPEIPGPKRSGGLRTHSRACRRTVRPP